MGLFGNPITIDFEQIAFKELQVTGFISQKKNRMGARTQTDGTRHGLHEGVDYPRNAHLRMAGGIRPL